MASDSEEIEYQALGGHPLATENDARGVDDEEDDSEISLHEEQGFLVHMSPEVNKSIYN